MPRGAATRCVLAFTALTASLAVALSADAQPAPHSSTQIVFLGTGGGPPLRVDRSEPSTLLIVGGRYYLIDCGIGTARRLVEAGVDSDEIRTIFFTHLHADHDMGLADVMANDFLKHDPGAGEPIDIYGPPQTRELIDSAFHFVSVGFRPFAAENPRGFQKAGDGFVSPFVSHEIEHGGLIFRDDRIRVSAVENSHYALMPAKDGAVLKSYSYRVETPDGVIVFTGDTGPSDAVAQLAKGADVLIPEASYRDAADLDQLINSMASRNRWTPARAKLFRGHFEDEHLDTDIIGRIAAGAGVKAVVLYHYNPRSKADQVAYVRGVKARFSGPVFAPDDLDRYCLSSGALRSCNGKGR